MGERVWVLEEVESNGYDSPDTIYTFPLSWKSLTDEHSAAIEVHDTDAARGHRLAQSLLTLLNGGM